MYNIRSGDKNNQDWTALIATSRRRKKKFLRTKNFPKDSRVDFPLLY